MLNKLFIFIKKTLNIFGFEISKFEDGFNSSIYKTLCTEEQLESKPFYNIGSGSFHHPYWTNIDFISDWYRPVQKNIIHHDLMSKLPLPIATSSAKIIYTSHTIEHIKEDAVQFLFEESYRCLEDSGILRITTGPDAETDFRALMNNDEDWFYWYKHNPKDLSYKKSYHQPATSVPLSERWLHHVATQLAPNSVSPSKIKLSDKEIWNIIDEKGFPKALDYFCDLCEFQSDRPGNHISWWNHDKVFKFLKNAGFNKIYRSGYRQSCSPLMRKSKLFDNTYPQISLYVEAIK